VFRTSFKFASQSTREIHPSGDVRLHAFLLNLIKDASGVTAIEYALIAALIAVAAIGAFTLVGTDLSNTFSSIASQL
jgi:pilus assembly protein Flp/PilA